MNATRIKRAVVTLLAIYLLSVPTAHSQRPGQVSGLVVDQTGAVITGASVTLFSEDRVRTVKADQYGRFDFQDLPEGFDDLEVSSPGFITVTTTNVQASERGVFEIVLGVGECTECVTVQPCFAVATTKISYEARPDDASVAGIIDDPSHMPLDRVWVLLAKSEAGPVYAVSTNEKGELQFGSVVPGRYTLRVTRDNYSAQLATLWVTRENLTRIGRFPSETCLDATGVPRFTSSPLPDGLIPPP